MKSQGLIAVLMTGVLFLVMFGSGAWLAYSGKPGNYVTALVTIHKLISVLTAVATGVTMYLLANGR